jgi:hypothetical protein
MKKMLLKIGGEPQFPTSPASEEQILLFEDKSKIKLPLDYREYLAKINGGFIKEPNKIEIPILEKMPSVVNFKIRQRRTNYGESNDKSAN